VSVRKERHKCVICADSAPVRMRPLHVYLWLLLLHRASDFCTTNERPYPHFPKSAAGTHEHTRSASATRVPPEVHPCARSPASVGKPNVGRKPVCMLYEWKKYVSIRSQKYVKVGATKGSFTLLASIQKKDRVRKKEEASMTDTDPNQVQLSVTTPETDTSTLAAVAPAEVQPQVLAESSNDQTQVLSQPGPGSNSETCANARANASASASASTNANATAQQPVQVPWLETAFAAMGIDPARTAAMMSERIPPEAHNMCAHVNPQLFQQSLDQLMTQVAGKPVVMGDTDTTARYLGCIAELFRTSATLGELFQAFPGSILAASPASASTTPATTPSTPVSAEPDAPATAATTELSPPSSEPATDCAAAATTKREEDLYS
jgi:hypothetical protein